MNFCQFNQANDPLEALCSQCSQEVFRDSSDTEPDFERLGSDAKLIYLLWVFDSEIYNCGLRYFLETGTADFLPQIHQGLQRIRATRTLDLLNRAMACFPAGQIPLDYTERVELLERLDEDIEIAMTLDDLGDQIRDDPDDIMMLLSDFMQRNPQSPVSKTVIPKVRTAVL